MKCSKSSNGKSLELSGKRLPKKESLGYRWNLVKVVERGEVIDVREGFQYVVFCLVFRMKGPRVLFFSPLKCGLFRGCGLGRMVVVVR